MLLAQRLVVARPFRRSGRAAETRTHRETSWHQLVRACLAAEMTDVQTVDHVAETMFYDALTAGGGESDIGLFGPRLFARDARALVAAERRKPLH